MRLENLINAQDSSANDVAYNLKHRLHSPLQELAKQMQAQFAMRNALVHPSLTAFRDMEAVVPKFRRTLNFDVGRLLRDVEQIINVHRHVFQLTSRIADVTSQFAREIEQRHNSFRLLAEHSARLHLGKVASGLNETLKNYLEQSNAVGKLVQSFVQDNFAFKLQSALLEDVLRNEVAVTVEPVLSSSELLAKVEEGLEQAGIGEETLSPDSFVPRLTAWLNKLHPDLRSIIVSVIAGLIVNWLWSIAHKEPTFNTTVKTRVKIVHQHIRNTQIVKTVGADIRVVSASQLSIHKKPRVDSEQIATLQAPQIVVVIKKRKNWTEVAWREPDSEVIRKGWTHTRYLKK